MLTPISDRATSTKMVASTTIATLRSSGRKVRSRTALPAVGACRARRCMVRSMRRSTTSHTNKASRPTTTIETRPPVSR